MKYKVVNLPSPRLGNVICGDRGQDVAKPAIAAAQASWAAVKSFKSSLDTNQKSLVSILSEADAAEFKELYAYALANEAGVQAALDNISKPWAINDAKFCLTVSENALVHTFASKTDRLKELMAKATPGQTIATWGSGGHGHPSTEQGVTSGSQETPAGAAQPSADAAAPATPSGDALKKDTTKNLLIGGGILAAISTGIWALVKK